MVMKQIKVTDSVKGELDAMMEDKETYNLVIQRLIDENKRLFIENQRLGFDKSVLMSVIVDDTSFTDLKFKYVPFIESVLFNSMLSDDECLNYLVKYFDGEDSVDTGLLVDCVDIVMGSYGDVERVSGVLGRFKKTLI